MPAPRAIKILNGELLEDILATVQSETRREKYRKESEVMFPGAGGLGLIAFINKEMISEGVAVSAFANSQMDDLRTGGLDSIGTAAFDSLVDKYELLNKPT